MSTAPSCPITGEPAAEKLSEVRAGLLVKLWRHGAGVEPTPLRWELGPIGLWRSPCGLRFFHPAVAGDAAFYGSFYRRHGGHALLSRQAAQRSDFRAVAEQVRPGDRVLDVGCGEGAFAALLPAGATYTGLDPNAGEYAGTTVMAETPAEHAARCPEAYDVVSAFHVIEHATDPLGLARDLLRCLRPGGLLALAMPVTPSVLTEIPNNLLNAPPHHLTLWNAAAGEALCRVLGLHPVRIGPVPASPHLAPLHWIARLCPVKAGERQLFRASFRWHAAVAAAYALAWPMARLFGLPRGAAPVDMVVLARKPGH